MDQTEVKEQVRQFYDRIGWQVTDEGFYQNARYEDLRPVSAQYIHRCHLRVKRYLKPGGKFFLDAGSGPIQYPEYRVYSDGYAYRVCLDISIVALREARSRIGDHGLFVVADVANLPFASKVFDGIVSLHTLHHLPMDEQVRAYDDLYRALMPGSVMVLVNGWTESFLMLRMQGLVRLMEKAGNWWIKQKKEKIEVAKDTAPQSVIVNDLPKPAALKDEATGTFIRKLDARWLCEQLHGKNFEIRCWRSVSVRFLRWFIRSWVEGCGWVYYSGWKIVSRIGLA
jgi:SAM-dependent methyltransferase